jgi:hypothetical protein
MLFTQPYEPATKIFRIITLFWLNLLSILTVLAPLTSSDGTIYIISLPSILFLSDECSWLLHDLTTLKR